MTALRRRRTAPALLESTVEVTVPFQDGDPSGVVWHGNYFRYFDAARCALLARFDYGYREMQASGYVWPIVDTRVRFLRPARHDEVLLVTAKLIEYEFRLKIAYEVENAAGERVTEGYTIQVAVDAGTDRMCLGSPAVMVERIRSCLNGAGE